MSHEHIKPGHPKVLIAVAHGSEDTEVVAIIDTLRRAECDVTVGKILGDKDKNVEGDDLLLCTLAKGTTLVIIQSYTHTL